MRAQERSSGHWSVPVALWGQFNTVFYIDGKMKTLIQKQVANMQNLEVPVYVEKKVSKNYK